MARAGFYNDNEYRAYPFIYVEGGTPASVYAAGTENPGVVLPTSAVVDCGVIMGLDAQYDETTHSVWLHSVSRTGATITFTLKTDATTATLQFSRAVDSATWEIEFAESAAANLLCAEEPIWDGFLVSGPLTELAEQISSGTTLTFAKNAYQLEPSRIQNLNKGYLRSISVGNYSRTVVPPCGAPVTNTDRTIVANALCLKDNIRLKEGYNCQITQTDRSSELVVSASKGAGAKEDAALCEHGSELPLYENEPFNPNTGLYSGGATCGELIGTINGLGGPTITILGVNGVDVKTEDDTLVIEKRPNSQAACT
jgi:hypothetical protein